MVTSSKKERLTNAVLDVCRDKKEDRGTRAISFMYLWSFPFNWLSAAECSLKWAAEGREWGSEDKYGQHHRNLPGRHRCKLTWLPDDETHPGVKELKAMGQTFTLKCSDKPLVFWLISRVFPKCWLGIILLISWSNNTVILTVFWYWESIIISCWRRGLAAEIGSDVTEEVWYRLVMRLTLTIRKTTAHCIVGVISRKNYFLFLTIYLIVKEAEWYHQTSSESSCLMHTSQKWFLLGFCFRSVYIPCMEWM